MNTHVDSAMIGDAGSSLARLAGVSELWGRDDTAEPGPVGTQIAVYRD